MDFKHYLSYISREDLLPILPSDTDSTDIPLDEIRVIVKNLIKADKVSANVLRKIWLKALEGIFFTEFQKAYIFDPTEKFSSTNDIKTGISKGSKKAITELGLPFPKFYSSKINENPTHYVIALTFENVDKFEDYLTLPLAKQLIINFFPTKGLATCWTDTSDEERDQKIKYSGKLFTEILENTVEVRVNALLLRKYSSQETINHLTISTPHDIAGFSGIDKMEFNGPDVMMGLAGLKRRHDADVEKIVKVGPFTKIISNVLHLQAGKGLIIKSYEGIDSLHKALKA